MQISFEGMEKKIKIVHYAKGRKGQVSRARAQMTASKDYAESFLVLSSRVDEPWEDQWSPEIMVRWFLTARSTLGRFKQEVATGVWLARQARSGRFDLLHIHENTGLVVGAVWALLCRSPLIFDTHDLFNPQVTESEKWIRRFCSWFKWEVLQGYVIKRSLCALHVSTGILDIYRHKFPSGRHELLWNLPSFLLADDEKEFCSKVGKETGRSEAVNDSVLRLKKGRNGHRENHEPLRLIYFGLLSSARISIQLIRTIASIPGVELTLAGRLYEDIDDAAEYAREFLRAVEELPVKWKGAYTNAILPNLLANIDLLIHPIPVVTENTRHALPNKFFESCASGKGLIYSNVFLDMGQLACEYGFGMPFDPLTPDSVVEVIQALLADRAKVDQMKINARMFIMNSCWSPKSYKNTLSEIYGRR